MVLEDTWECYITIDGTCGKGEVIRETFPEDVEPTDVIGLARKYDLRCEVLHEKYTGTCKNLSTGKTVLLSAEDDQY